VAVRARPSARAPCQVVSVSCLCDTCTDQWWPCRGEQHSERGAARARAQGRAQFELYQKLLALGFAVVQAVGQLSLLRPYVADWSPGWLLDSTVTLVAGAMILVHARPSSRAPLPPHFTTHTGKVAAAGHVPACASRPDRPCGSEGLQAGAAVLPAVRRRPRPCAAPAELVHASACARTATLHACTLAH